MACLYDLKLSRNGHGHAGRLLRHGEKVHMEVRGLCPSEARFPWLGQGVPHFLKNKRVSESISLKLGIVTWSVWVFIEEYIGIFMPSMLECLGFACSLIPFLLLLLLLLARVVPVIRDNDEVRMMILVFAVAKELEALLGPNQTLDTKTNTERLKKTHTHTHTHAQGTQIKWSPQTRMDTCKTNH